jgi:hypothetical protein
MKATVTAMIAARLPPSNIRRVLYDPEWTVDVTKQG